MGAPLKTQKQPTVETAVNPKTGRLWRLTDPEVSAKVKAVQRELTKDQASAVKFLQDNGFLTPGGKLTRRYGG